MSDIATAKQRHRDVFASLQMEVRGAGGFSALARQLGKNEQTFSMKFNPFDEKHQPSAIELLDVIELVGAAVAANAVAMKTGQVAIRQESANLSPRDLVNRCQQMLAECGSLIHHTATGLSDNHLSHDERANIASCLDQLIPLLIGVRAAARG